MISFCILIILKPSGWQNREKEGLPRLMEALHSNMWSTMEHAKKGQEMILFTFVFDNYEICQDLFKLDEVAFTILNISFQCDFFL